MSHLQYTAKSHHLQWNMKQLSKICHQFYRDYCPDSLKHRHVDSFPLPLCQPVRNHRASIFEGLADIGYNASEQL